MKKKFEVRPLIARIAIFTMLLGAALGASGCGSGSEFTPIDDDITNIITPPVVVAPVTKTLALQVQAEDGTYLHESRVVVLESGITRILQTYKVWSDGSTDEKEFRAAVDDVGINDSGVAMFQLYPGVYDVWVTRPLYKPVKLTSMSVGGDLNIQMVVPVTMTAAVSDELEFTGSLVGYVKASGGTALGGALVTIEGKTGTYHTVTDSSGRYKFFDIPIGTYDIIASLAGYGTFTANGVLVETAVTNTVTEIMIGSAVSFTVSGHLVNQSADPITGVDLYLVASDTKLPVLGTATATNSNGAFTFTGVIPGQYRIFAGIRNPADGYVRKPLPEITVVDRDITLSPFELEAGVH